MFKLTRDGAARPRVRREIDRSPAGRLAGASIAIAGLLALAAPAHAQSPQTKVTDPVPLLELVAPGGSGRLYTLSQAEANTAIGHGYKLQPVRTGYLRQAAFPGSQPLHRLRRNGGGGGSLVTASESERQQLVASGQFVYEGVVGHIATSQAPGLVRLMRWSNGKEWRVALEGAALDQQGYRLDGPLGWAHPRWIRAGALYFGSFDAKSTDVIAATKRVYGRDGDWWGGVRDYSGQDPAVPVKRWAWPNDDFSHLKPAIGFYDDAQTSTLEKHITQASSAGLRYFAFYWYWDPKLAQERIAEGLHSFGRASNRNLLDFGLTICAHAWSDGILKIPVEQYGQAADAIVGYLRQPNYLRANDGRPIVWLCDSRGLGSGSTADVRGFTDAVRAKARAAIGEDVLILAHRDLGLDLPAAGADGSYCGARPEAVGLSYRRYVDEQRAYLAGGPPNFVRCIMSDFDERPRYPIALAEPGQARWMPDQTLDLFRQVTRTTREDIDASTRPPVVDNFVLAYAWNEWHEGGIIEPNAKEGCAYLDAIRAELMLTGGGGCIANPPDPTTGSSAPAATPRPPQAAGRPVLSKFRVAPARFRLGKRTATARAANRTWAARAAADRRKRTPAGTKLRYRLSQRARVTIAIARTHGGVRLGRRCVAPTRSVLRKLRGKRRRPCDRRVASLVRTSPAGNVTVSFSGWYAGRRHLVPGRYVATATARAGGAASTARRAHFQVVRR